MLFTNSYFFPHRKRPPAVTFSQVPLVPLFFQSESNFVACLSTYSVIQVIHIVNRAKPRIIFAYLEGRNKQKFSFLVISADF